VTTLALHKLCTRHLGPLTLELQARCTTLNGPSGSGKTVLLRAIADLDPHEGEARLDGVGQQQLPPTEWRRKVAYLPAESHWWGDRLGEHFEGGDAALLESLGFESDVLEWEVARLSSGERQRLALARLLALEPRVLLLDEPTANLDAANRQRTEAVIFDYLARSGALALWVTHDPEQGRRIGTRHLRIDGGSLLEDGLVEGAP